MTAVAYVVGWSFSNAYYSRLGAAWIVPDLRPSELLASFSALALAIPCGFIFFLQGLLAWEWKPTKVLLSGLVALLITGCAMPGVDSNHMDHLDLLGQTCLYVSVIGLILAVSIFLSLAVQKFLAPNKQHGDVIWTVAFFLMLLLLSYGPEIFGGWRAGTDRNPASTSLRPVDLDDADLDGWRLLRDTGTNLILIRLKEGEELPTTRIVKRESVTEIRPPKKVEHGENFAAAQTSPIRTARSQAEQFQSTETMNSVAIWILVAISLLVPATVVWAWWDRRRRHKQVVLATAYAIAGAVREWRNRIWEFERSWNVEASEPHHVEQLTNFAPKLSVPAPIQVHLPSFYFLGTIGAKLLEAAGSAPLLQIDLLTPPPRIGAEPHGASALFHRVQTIGMFLNDADKWIEELMHKNQVAL